MRRRIALVLLALLAGTACTGGDASCASLPGGSRYCLQPTTALPPFDAQQSVAITVDGRRETLLVELEVDADGMRFAALTPFGSTVMQAGYDNRQAKTAAWPERGPQPALLLALLQLALWPAESVRAGLGAALVLEEAAGRRRLMQDGIPLVEVVYTGGTLSGAMRIVVPSAQMEIEIKTLDGSATP